MVARALNTHSTQAVGSRGARITLLAQEQARIPRWLIRLYASLSVL